MPGGFIAPRPNYSGRIGGIVYTIGHSTHPLEEFVAMLAAHSIDYLLDVRTVPKSRRNPQYNQEALPAALEARGIAYGHEPRLGGLRHPRPNSINSAWKNDSFRGYADHMQTPEFDAAIRRLIALSHERTPVVMCAEAVPWRCHRSLIADALAAHGVPAFHIMSAATANPHRITPFAVIEGSRVTYPGLTA
ncbi:MAG TPA: DUF488 domain-containing protein [Bryobacteraceae bacterium]|nr:DUF488 domain-containing protein [Bryobacteraceae bacterium]